jgi:hypothetical protein
MSPKPIQRAVLVTTGDGEFTVMYEPIARLREDDKGPQPPQAAMDLFVDACDKGLPN